MRKNFSPWAFMGVSYKIIKAASVELVNQCQQHVKVLVVPISGKCGKKWRKGLKPTWVVSLNTQFRSLLCMSYSTSSCACSSGIYVMISFITQAFSSINRLLQVRVDLRVCLHNYRTCLCFLWLEIPKDSSILSPLLQGSHGIGHTYAM